MRFQIIYSDPFSVPVSDQFGTHQDHHKCEASRIFHARFGRRHEILKTEMLFRVSKVELDLKSQTVIINQLFPVHRASESIVTRPGTVSIALAITVNRREETALTRVSKQAKTVNISIEMNRVFS